MRSAVAAAVPDLSCLAVGVGVPVLAVVEYIALDLQLLSRASWSSTAYHCCRHHGYL